MKRSTEVKKAKTLRPRLRNLTAADEEEEEEEGAEREREKRVCVQSTKGDQTD